MIKMKNVWGPLLVLLLLLFSWEYAVQMFRIPEWLLPTPSGIFDELITGWSIVQGHIMPTVLLSISGFFMGSVIGVLVAVFLHLIPFLRQAVYPLLIVSQNIPIIVLAPLLVIWFGFGYLPKLIVITLVCFFPITVALMDGLRRTGSELLHYMEMSGATRKQIFLKLEWPHALPSLFSGLKISATYSVMGAVISEWLGASKGLGVYMTLASSSFKTDRVFVAIFIIVLLSLIFFLIIVLGERLFVKWRPEEEKGKHERT